jgi:lipopolysaccharide biosynthesis glycosyltransferase
MIIDIVLAGDAAFHKQLATTIGSISALDDGASYRVHVLHDGYDAADRARVEESVGARLSVEWLQVPAEWTRGALLPHWLPAASTHRLFMGELLPAECRRAIYLDADLVAADSLVPLWQLALGGNAVGAVRDAMLPWVGASRGDVDFRALDLPSDLPYYNCGVLLIDLEQWRALEIGARTIALLEQCRFKNGDNSALNIALGADWQRLDPRWNLQAGHFEAIGSLAWVAEPNDELTAAIQDPAIVHFNNSSMGKPWDWGCTHPFRDRWFEFLDQTAWAGWRPRRPSLATRLAFRARRAGGGFLRGARGQ